MQHLRKASVKSDKGTYFTGILVLSSWESNKFLIRLYFINKQVEPWDVSQTFSGVKLANCFTLIQASKKQKQNTH